ncbi:hypothetical protein [Halovivax cerinus]|uniref:Uncharacterized protein n=1 Tax=Halovivax cerinus TaxID=1487865 RepID=A0ABD5NJI8_9EURY|nr:hypothetical protein [Halovivax cerinus]
MKRRQYIVATSGTTLLALGSAGAQEGSGDEESDESEWPPFVPDDFEPDPFEFEGEGSEIREGIEIDGGLTVVRAAYDGPEIGTFIVEFVPEEGDVGDLFQNQLEPYEGERAAAVEAGTYVVDVEADGEWSLAVYQPRAESGNSPPVEVSGETDRVFGPYEFGGTHVATGSHTGEGNFIVEVVPMEVGQFGGFSELVFNEIGAVDGIETAFQYEGIGWVGVRADGEWTLAME